MFILHSQYHGCWCPGDARSQGISSHGIDLVLPVSAPSKVKYLHVLFPLFPVDLYVEGQPRPGQLGEEDSGRQEIPHLTDFFTSSYFAIEMWLQNIYIFHNESKQGHQVAKWHFHIHVHVSVISRTFLHHVPSLLLIFRAYFYLYNFGASLLFCPFILCIFYFKLIET